MAYSWSPTARRDFKEREKYREEHGEIDRYRKRGPSNEATYAETLVNIGITPEMERTWESDSWSVNDELNSLLGETPDLSAANRIRAGFAYRDYMTDSYDADYDDLMAGYQRLKDYSVSQLLGAGTPSQGKNETVIVEETTDTDPRTYDSLWN